MSGKPMSNLRRERRGSRSFTTIDNEFIRRTDLSWEARGLLTYLLSLPNDWQIRMTHLESQAPAGRDQLRRIVKELEGAGYIERRARHDGKRLTGWDFYFDELPVADRLETSPTGNQSDGKPAATNKRDIRIKESTNEASPLPAQGGKSEKPSPPVKKEGSAKTDLSILKERAFEAYRELRLDHWIDHKKYPRDCDAAMREALEHADGDVDAAAELVRGAISFAANDTFWWGNPNKSNGVSMANMLRQGKVVTNGEKWQALQQTDAKHTVELYDLTIGNPWEKVKQISKRVSHTRDASEEEWRYADDDSKARFIRPGRAYHVTHAGAPGTPGYVGLAEVLRIEQIYVVAVTADGQELRTHVSNLGRESYERDTLRRGDELPGGVSAPGGERGGPGDGGPPAQRADGGREPDGGDGTGDQASGVARAVAGVGAATARGAAGGVGRGAEGAEGHRASADTSRGAKGPGSDGPERDGDEPEREVPGGRARSGANQPGGTGGGASHLRVREGGREPARDSVEHAGRQPDRGDRRGEGGAGAASSNGAGSGNGPGNGGRRGARVPAARGVGGGAREVHAVGGGEAGPADNGGRGGVPGPDGGERGAARPAAPELSDSGNSVHLRPDRPGERGAAGEPGRRADVGESERDDGRGNRRHPLPRPLRRHDSGEF